MNNTKTDHFDEAAAGWDAEPRRIELAKAVGKTILGQVQPTQNMDVLDYGCGTGLLGLFLLPHVRSVTGADSSSGMLQILEQKTRAGNLQQMKTIKLDLQNDSMPESRYHLIAANMVLHHVERIDALLAAFYRMLLPGGHLTIADLDLESGLFHSSGNSESVFHHGFDRKTFKKRLCRAGFVDVNDVTAHVIRKPIANGDSRDFSVFLMAAHRSKEV